MAGYLLVNESMLQPWKSDGIAPQPLCLGFMDYLRELRQEVFPFNPHQRLRIVGVEDVLLATGGHVADCISYVHRVMSARANNLEQTGGYVQVVFRRKLSRAEDFWLEDGMRRISIRRLFGSPVRQSDPVGNEYYTVGFNLT